ncbi:MAG: hypothetical protein A3H94_06830 [Acidobacteria bacterium RIFCSPLOWO2_02_FULL_60_20]|nr:MAG: hypothetical protein A3H94_06830 [Acidobacteria bacterium RIFCSPLOWO2_02_FULL_60_20]
MHAEMQLTAPQRNLRYSRKDQSEGEMIPEAARHLANEVGGDLSASRNAPAAEAFSNAAMTLRLPGA